MFGFILTSVEARKITGIAREQTTNTDGAYSPTSSIALSMTTPVANPSGDVVMSPPSTSFESGPRSSWIQFETCCACLAHRRQFRVSCRDISGMRKGSCVEQLKYPISVYVNPSQHNRAISQEGIDIKIDRRQEHVWSSHLVMWQGIQTRRVQNHPVRVSFRRQKSSFHKVWSQLCPSIQVSSKNK